MNFFNFFKTKKHPLDKIFKEMSRICIPNGRKDIDSGTKELLYILNDTIDQDKARNIFLKSIGISVTVENFDRERLVGHLKGYCLDCFNEKQVDQFYKYLSSLRYAMKIGKKSPSEVVREGEDYSW